MAQANTVTVYKRDRVGTVDRSISMGKRHLIETKDT